MKTNLLIIFLILGTITLIYPPSAYACSLAFDVSFLMPLNEKLHGDCSTTTGTISWTGMIYIMILLIIPTIIIKRKKKLSKKFYLLIPVIILLVILSYSVFVYGTLDLTEFAMPHGIYGGIDYDTVAWLDTEKDFKKILDDKNIIYSIENFNTNSDYQSNSRNYNNADYQIVMPAKYCGFVVSDDEEDYWYTATFDKIIISSELHEENPYDCSGKSKECTCNMEERIRGNFFRK